MKFMKLKKYLLLLPLVALGLVACDSTPADDDPSTIEPDEPETPTEPEDPETPEDLEDPVDPETPSEPEDPVEPETPVDYTALIESVLETLQADPLIYEVDFAIPVYDHESTIQGYISSTRYWYEELQDDGFQVDIKDIWRTDDGFVGTQKIDLETNEVGVTTTDATTVFDDTYYNPFDLLASEDATVTDNVINFDIDENTGESILYLLTGWLIYGGFDEVRLDVVIDASTSEITSVVLDYDDSFITLSLSLVDEGDIAMSSGLTSREETDDTEDLQNALDALAAADSLYTDVSYIDVYGSEGEAVIQYDKSSGAILVTEDGADGFGAINTTEGMMTFDYSNGYYFSTGTTLGQVNDLVPSYTVLGNMFDLQTDGTFLFAIDGQEDELRDLLLIETYVLGSYVYPDTGTLFVDVHKDGEEIVGISYTYKYGSRYTINVSVTINEGSLNISESSIFEDTSLNRVLVESFGDRDNMSYTQNVTYGSREYEIDENSEPIGEPVVDSASLSTRYVDGDAIRFGEENSSSTYYYVNNESGGVDYYTYDQRNQTYTISTSYTGMSWQDGFRQGNTWVGILSYFSVESDTTSVSSNEDIYSTALSALGLSSVGVTITSFEFSLTYDEDEETITAELLYNTGIYFTDETYTDAVYMEYFVTAVYSNIGSTYVDTSMLGT